jgi:hypothetical protein
MLLTFQLLLLVIFCVLGTLTFCWVEWLTHRDAILAASNERDAKNDEQVRKVTLKNARVNET